MQREVRRQRTRTKERTEEAMKRLRLLGKGLLDLSIALLLAVGMYYG